MELLNDKMINFLFSSVPKPAELCHVIGYVSISEISKAPPQKSKYHLKILKCRQIIFMELGVIAAPSDTEECAVDMIMKKEFYHNGHILKLLEKLRLSFKYSDTVSVSVYEACLRYTLIARVSPFWNQVGKYLIEGRDFLTNSGKMNAVKIEIVIKEGEMYLLFWSVHVKLPAFHLEHLEVSTSIKFKGNDKSVDLPWGINFAQVLPSLRKGSIVRVSNNMSNHWLYKSYKDIRRHWKNMYGYRLPEDPTNLLFYGVKFQSPKSNEFTYPSVCLKPNGLIFFRTTDQKAILRSFLSTLMVKVPSICGSQFGINPRVGVAVPRLHFSNELLENPNVVLFDAEILSRDQKDVTSEPLELAQAVPEKAEVSETSSETVRSYPTPTPLHIKRETAEILSKDQKDVTSQPLEHTQAVPEKAEVSETSSVTVRSYPTPTPLHTKRETISLNSQSVYLPVTLTSNSNFERNMIQRSKLMPMFPPNNSSFASFTQVNREIQQRRTVVSHSTEYVDRSIKFGLYDRSVTPQASSTSSEASTSSEVSSVKVKLECGAVPKQHFFREVPLSGTCSILDVNFKLKKPRSRPQVQAGVDVEALARGNDLARANTATLINWLRQKNIPCKVKDRKADLVAKVKEYFKIDDE